MLLGLHIVSAILSIIVTGVALVRPSQKKLLTCYALATTALASGTYLIVISDKSILRSCIAGITYFAIVSIGISLVRKKVASATSA